MGPSEGPRGPGPSSPPKVNRIVPGARSPTRTWYGARVVQKVGCGAPWGRVNVSRRPPRKVMMSDHHGLGAMFGCPGRYGGLWWLGSITYMISDTCGAKSAVWSALGTCECI